MTHLGNIFHCSFLQVFYLAVSLSQISYERNIDYLDATKLSMPEQKAGKMVFWDRCFIRSLEAWSFSLLVPRAWEQTSSPRRIWLTNQIWLPRTTGGFVKGTNITDVQICEWRWQKWSSDRDNMVKNSDIGLEKDFQNHVCYPQSDRFVPTVYYV